MDPLRLLVMGDDPLARHGISMLLAGRSDVQIVGQVGTSDDLAASIRAHDPQVVAWDLGSNAASDLDRLREVEEGPPILVILSPGGDPAEALAAGAQGVLLRDIDSERLAAAAHAVANGLVVLDEALAESSIRLRPSGETPPQETLTPRELEVLQLVSQGLPNKQIAARLGISEHTVKFHVNAILGKLGVQSRTEAVGRALRLGLIVL